jgi:hypothetical protein
MRPAGAASWSCIYSYIMGGRNAEAAGRRHPAEGFASKGRDIFSEPGPRRVTVCGNAAARPVRPDWKQALRDIFKRWSRNPRPSRRRLRRLLRMRTACQFAFRRFGNARTLILWSVRSMRLEGRGAGLVRSCALGRRCQRGAGLRASTACAARAIASPAPLRLWGQQLFQSRGRGRDRPVRVRLRSGAGDRRRRLIVPGHAQRLLDRKLEQGLV